MDPSRASHLFCCRNENLGRIAGLNSLEGNGKKEEKQEKPGWVWQGKGRECKELLWDLPGDGSARGFHPPKIGIFYNCGHR